MYVLLFSSGKVDNPGERNFPFSVLAKRETERESRQSVITEVKNSTRVSHGEKSKKE
jgi:hypothetical protein